MEPRERQGRRSDPEAALTICDKQFSVSPGRRISGLDGKILAIARRVCDEQKACPRVSFENSSFQKDGLQRVNTHRT